MSTLGTLLRRVLGDEAVLRECRNCGTTVPAEQSECPDCGGDEIATYRLT
jgi:rRNA maturation endonuclease Nob1